MLCIRSVVCEGVVVRSLQFTKNRRLQVNIAQRLNTVNTRINKFLSVSVEHCKTIRKAFDVL